MPYEPVVDLDLGVAERSDQGHDRATLARLVDRVRLRCRLDDEPEPGLGPDRTADARTWAHAYGHGVEVGQARALRILSDEVARLAALERAPIAEPSA